MDPATYSYDADGNLTSITTSRHLGWNHSGRLTSYRNQAGNAAPTLSASYLYDSSGTRVKKFVVRGPVVESVVYIDGTCEYVTRSSGAAVSTQNTLHVVLGSGRVATIRVGTPMPGDATPATKYVLGDHLGSAAAVVDDTGNWVNREEFSPYGETLLGSYAYKRYRFAGRERDEESGLDYSQARFYAPWLARWISPDPLTVGSLEANLNPYVYAGGRPIATADLSGLDERVPTPASAQGYTGIPGIDIGRAIHNVARTFGGANGTQSADADRALAPTDWLADDITNWRRDLFNGYENTFVKAARYNTENNLPGEYKTIFLRSEYYAVIDALLQQSTATKDIRFFAAASKVTSDTGLGAIEGDNLFLPLAHRDPETEKILRDVNVLLFSANIKIANRLLNLLKAPTDPRAPSSGVVIAPMDFDLNMVEAEQAIVSTYLAGHSREITPKARIEINNDLNLTGFFPTIARLTGADDSGLQWARKGEGVETLNFFVQRDRVAVGKALIFQFHSRSLDDYEKYISSGIR